MSVHGLAVATAVATYLLILVGGLVHGTGSSLACPDWPTCYGTMMPKMEGGVAVEHSHRLAAGVVLILTLVLAVALTLSRDPVHRGLRRLGWFAMALVMVQAILGGVTVLMRLPTPVSTLHTATSLLFFGVTLVLAFRSRAPRSAAIPPAEPTPSELADTARPPLARRAVYMALIAAVGVYFQMVLGGLVRHSGAALACLDVPLCRGTLWPADAHPTVLVQALHRLGALVVTALVLVSSVVTFRATRGRSDALLLRALAVTAPLLVAIQVWLGLHAITSFLDLATVEAHLGVATALLAIQLAVALAGMRAASAQGEAAAQPRPWHQAVSDLVQLAKPRITGLVMSTFAGGMWLAPGDLPQWRIVMTVIGTGLMVGAANALNMFLERDIDGLMERTRSRPLPTGRLSPEAALVFGTALAFLALPLLLLAGNALTGILGGLAFLSYVLLYTPMKRTSPAALFVGAVPGALPPLMGWTAVTGRLDAGALTLFGILFFWQIPHFLAIALYRADDYARAELKVLPLVVSNGTTRVHIVGFSAVLVLLTVLLATPLRIAGPLYLVTASLLGAGFLAVGFAGFRRLATRLWARSVFVASLVYLTLLFAALILDRTLT